MTELAHEETSELRGLGWFDISRAFADRVALLAIRMDIGQEEDVFAEFKIAAAEIDEISIGHLDKLSYISAKTPKYFVPEVSTPEANVFHCQEYEFDFNSAGINVWFTDYLSAASPEELEDPEFDGGPRDGVGTIPLNNVEPRLVSHWDELTAYEHIVLDVIYRGINSLTPDMQIRKR